MRMKGHVLCLLLSLLPIAAQAQQQAKTLPAQGTVEVAFSPWDDPEAAILRALASAQKTIQVQIYTFTSRPIAKALLAAHKRGVAVQILADLEQMEKVEQSQIPHLAAAGIPVWLETRYAAAHNKLIIIDANESNSAVITGSYNFTYSAQARNAENLLILRGNPLLVEAYSTNWLRHQRDATPYQDKAN